MTTADNEILNDSQSPNNQNQNQSNGSDNKQRGYSAMPHDVLEKIYGPESPMDLKYKVFFFIFHKLNRNWQYVRAISRADIKKATGIDERYLTRALDSLENEKMIISHKSKTGKIWNTTQYALHPEMFGYDTLWRGEGSQITKGQLESTHEIDTCGKIIPISRKRVLTGSQEGGPAPQSGGGTDYQSGPNSLKFSELMDILASKNPSYNNPNTKNPISEDLNFSGKKKRTPEEHIQIIKEQIKLAKAGKL